MQLTNKMIAEMRQAVDVDNPLTFSRYHTDLYTALCVSNEARLEEGLPTQEWAGHPWLVAVDRDFREKLYMGLAEWLKMTHPVFKAVEFYPDTLREGLYLIRDRDNPEMAQASSGVNQVA